MAFFGGNPFSSPVGQRIEQATDAALASENWALNMEICDIINDTDDGPKDAVKAIRKRLHQNVGKNYTVVMYTLTVLETCVKNCGRRFHLLAANKEFVQELVKLIGPKNDPPTAVQEKVLSLIQSWADAFSGNPEMAGVVQVYQDLKQKGVEFPMTDLDALAPIHTPQRTVTEPETIQRPPMSQSPVPISHGSPGSGVLPPSTMAAITVPITLTSEQLGKLRSELDVVQGNLRVFNEMLTELTPGQEHPSDLELLQELYKTLLAMQGRLVELLEKVANEEVTSELLQINDDVNNAFLRHSRFMKNRTGSQQASTEIPPLIDLGDQEPSTGGQDLHLQLAGISLNSASASSTLSNVPTVAAQRGAATDDDFDMFAQSRQATYESTKRSGSSYADNSNVEHVPGSLGNAAQNKLMLQKETDFDEMEAWLQDKPVESADGQQQSITSSEFDRFLTERAAAAERLPPLRNEEATGSQQSSRRQMDKEETENRLFAL